MEVHSLKMQESALTGEAHDVEKHSGELEEEDLPLGDRKNMAFKGTFITNGRGHGLVVQTGMETEMGKIARMLAVILSHLPGSVLRGAPGYAPEPAEA